MRKTFWFTAGIGLLVALLGMFVFSVPIIPDVLGERMEEWYMDQVVMVAIVGLAAGAGSGVLAQRRLRHQPHEVAATFLSRVASWGFWTMGAMVLLAAVLFFARAASASFVPFTAFNRFLQLAASGKFFGVLGAAAATTAFTYAAVTRGANWGGRYALLPPPAVPGRSVKHGA